MIELKELREKLHFTGICDDSRLIQPGDIFVCKQGKMYDGSVFIKDAINKGAVAVLSETPINHCSVPNFVSTNIASLVQELLEFLYPIDDATTIIGVTGTDGKTTTTSMIKHLIEYNEPCMQIGTNGVEYLDKIIPLPNTTPSNIIIRKFIHIAQLNGIKYIVLEASSIGLIQQRLKHIPIHYSVFTNLSLEHSDYHTSMDEYFNAKRILFLQTIYKIIVNNNDNYAHKIKDEFDNALLIDTATPALNAAMSIQGDTMKTTIEIDGTLYQYNLFGTYNISNFILAFKLYQALGMDLSLLQNKVITFPQIMGRLEYVTSIKNTPIYVDFAHTPNAIKQLLIDLDNVAIVTGAAGGKDKKKRPSMGLMATTYATFVVFTEEDPDLEDPNVIIASMLEQVTSTNYEVILDRKTAIHYILDRANEFDFIIIAGKGREITQRKDGAITNYSDIDVILAYDKEDKAG